MGDGTNSATYSYVVNSPLFSQIVFTNNGTLRMTTTKSYDYLNRLSSIQSSAGGSTITSFSYANNLANQRTSMTNADNSYWVYQYDALGQVTSGKKYWSDGTPVAGQQFTYNFDDIGNRTNAAFGGDQTGANLRSANYTNNTLNQITSRNVPGYVNILGEATNLAAVYVNGQSTYRKGNYYWEELATDNTSSALWLGITCLAVLSNSPTSDITSTNTGNIFLAEEPEQFGYDADGNLIGDGRWTYTWDAENRLIDMTSQSSAPTGSQLKLDFLYDYQGRRIQKLVSTYNGYSYVAEYTNRFAYDGWNLIAILNSQSSILQSFEWGSDLSGSMQGAGGVGGLLIVNDSLTINNQPSSHFVAYDGNGNVSTLLNASTGATSANYAYGPFGGVIRSTGSMATTNAIRFSTKYQDSEADLIYYGYRYYNPSMGRWLGRDPIGEQGSLNSYCFNENDGISLIDPLGLQHFSYRVDAITPIHTFTDYMGITHTEGGDSVSATISFDVTANCNNGKTSDVTFGNFDGKLNFLWGNRFEFAVGFVKLYEEHMFSPTTIDNDLSSPPCCQAKQKLVSVDWWTQTGFSFGIPGIGPISIGPDITGPVLKKTPIKRVVFNVTITCCGKDLTIVDP